MKKTFAQAMAIRVKKQLTRLKNKMQRPVLRKRTLSIKHLLKILSVVLIFSNGFKMLANRLKSRVLNFFRFIFWLAPQGV